jgi:hypothetical protein
MASNLETTLKLERCRVRCLGSAVSAFCEVAIEVSMEKSVDETVNGEWSLLGLAQLPTQS